MRFVVLLALLLTGCAHDQSAHRLLWVKEHNKPDRLLWVRYDPAKSWRGAWPDTVTVIEEDDDAARFQRSVRGTQKWR